MKKTIVYIFILSVLCVSMAGAQQVLRGRVLDIDTGSPVARATVTVKGTAQTSLSDADGRFSVPVSARDTVVFHGVRYDTLYLYAPFGREDIVVRLTPQRTALQEVVVSTGYQTLPKERATGSFVQLDNDLLNRSVSTNITDRLRDIVPGLSFNTYGNSALSIRGQSTIFGNAEPLIVIDNFPYEGELVDINPNDVESITVLKDAAAASIWGSRAGNGVIVITTRKGRAGSPLNIGFNAGTTVVNKPDLYVWQTLPASDYIDIERRLFEEGYYDAAKNSGYRPLSPVVELLYGGQADPGRIPEIDREIERMKTYDVRKDADRYLYRKGVFQQYALTVNGDVKNNNYYASVGYDNNRESLIGNGYDRVTVNLKNTFRPFGERLQVTTGVYFSNNNEIRNNPGMTGLSMSGSSSVIPYLRLADDNGRPLSTVRDYSREFIAGAMDEGLLDWNYFPLQEIQAADNRLVRNNLRMDASLRYLIADGLALSASYQHTEVGSERNNHRSRDTYYARDLINRFTQVDGGEIKRPVPLGGILDVSVLRSLGRTFRSQLDFSRQFGQKGEVSAIAGFETRFSRTDSKDFRYYGYEAEYARNAYVDYVTDDFPLYHDSQRRSSIPNNDDMDRFTDVFRSYYVNASYSYDRKYILSASARLDQSNLFGVRANQKGVPLWSAGLAWNISREGFYGSDILPYLKLRGSYGYNGNVNKSVTAFTTAAVSGYNMYQLPYATIINPPNPELRWERVQIINLGLDFSAMDNRVSGTLEIYSKRGLDLIGDSPLPPSSGIVLFTGNTADTKIRGLDANLSTRNTTGPLKWNTDLLATVVKERVTGYEKEAPATGGLGYIQSPYALPLPGRPLYALYSYSWAGLDPENGDPMGYIGEETSTDYTGIFADTDLDNMVYSGPLRPTFFGSVRNSFSYGNLTASFNITYRSGYYFRAPGIAYSNDYGLSSNSAAYAERWQSPGDETRTHVPSVPAQPDGNRDMFYIYSTALINRGDNIRLQDFRIDYRFGGLMGNKWFRNMNVYLYGNNIVLLWKSNDLGIDPDNSYADLPFTFSAGLKLDF